MQIIIAKPTVAKFNDMSNEITMTVLPVFGVKAEDINLGPTLTLCDGYANHSITEQGDNVVLEINDEAFVLLMRTYIKVAHMLAPIIKAVISVAEAFKVDFGAYNAFMMKRKGE